MTIGKTCFTYNGHQYRLSGFLFTYYSDKGENLQFAHCQEEEANSVFGVGVAGVIAPLTEIKILDREVSHDGFHSERARFYQIVEEEKEQLFFLKHLKPKMSQRSFKGVKTKLLNRRIREWFKNNSSFIH